MVSRENLNAYYSATREITLGIESEVSGRGTGTCLDLLKTGRGVALSVVKKPGIRTRSDVDPMLGYSVSLWFVIWQSRLAPVAGFDVGLWYTTMASGGGHGWVPEHVQCDCRLGQNLYWYYIRPFGAPGCCETWFFTSQAHASCSPLMCVLEPTHLCVICIKTALTHHLCAPKVAYEHPLHVDFGCFLFKSTFQRTTRILLVHVLARHAHAHSHSSGFL